MAHLRRDVDDDAAALRDHQSRGSLRNDERRSDIEPEQEIEGWLVDLEKGLRPGDAEVGGRLTPALWPRRSSRSRPANASRTASGLVTSSGSDRELPPPEAIPCATSSSSLPVRLTRMSSAPAAANRTSPIRALLDT